MNSEQGRTPDTGRPALSRLVGDTEEFARDIWAQRPLLRRSADPASGFSDLLDADAVDELVSTRGLRAPFLRVAKEGRTARDQEFTAGGGIGATITDQVSDDKLLGLFADGSTIVLQGLHRTWSPVIGFAQQLAADLGHPVQANAYITPAQNTGFNAHYDVHDVFVLQCDGSKRWVLHEPVLPSPLRTHEWSRRADAVAARAAQEPFLDVVLEPGDCLYLPRGWIHAASALGSVSIHLTLGIHPWHRHTLADTLARLAVSQLEDVDQARHSLPVDGLSDSQDDVDAVRTLLHRAIDQVDAQTLVEAITVQHRRTQRAAPVRPLAQVAAAESVGPDTRVRLREHLLAETRHVQGRTELRTRTGKWTVADADTHAVDLLLDGQVHAADELGEEFTRRVLRAGIAVPVTDA